MKHSIFSVSIIAAVCLLRFTTASYPDTDVSHRRSSDPVSRLPSEKGLRAVRFGRHRSTESPRTDPRHVSTVRPLSPVTPPPPDVVARRACVAIQVMLASDPTAVNTISDPFVRTIVSMFRATGPLARAVILPRVLSRWTDNMRALCSSTSSTTPSNTTSSSTPLNISSSTLPDTSTSSPSSTALPTTSSSAVPLDTSASMKPDTLSSTPPNLTPLFVPWYAENRIIRPAMPVPSIPSFPTLFRVAERH